MMMIRARSVRLAISALLLVLGACEKVAPPSSASSTAAPDVSAPTIAAQAPAPVVEEVLLTVGPELVPCTGVAPQTCLRVRAKPGGDWELFYDRIEGFDHEPGVETSLIARREPVEHPPADASAFRWTLVQVIGRRPLVVPP